MITPADLKTEFAKDFAADSDSVLQRAIDRAYRQIGTAWEDLADDGALFLAAHLRMISKQGSTGGSGPVQSKKVGEVSVTYAAAVPSAAEGSFGSTAYGREYLRMVALLPGARVYIDESDNYYDGIESPFVLGYSSDE